GVRAGVSPQEFGGPHDQVLRPGAQAGVGAGEAQRGGGGGRKPPGGGTGGGGGAGGARGGARRGGRRDFPGEGELCLGARGAGGREAWGYGGEVRRLPSVGLRGMTDIPGYRPGVAGGGRRTGPGTLGVCHDVSGRILPTLGGGVKREK